MNRRDNPHMGCYKCADIQYFDDCDSDNQPTGDAGWGCNYRDVDHMKAFPVKPRRLRCHSDFRLTDERLIVTIETDLFEASYEININQLLSYNNDDIRMKLIQMQTDAAADIKHAESMLRKIHVIYRNY